MRNILKYLKKYYYIAVLAPIFMILEVSMDLILANYMEKMIDYGIQTNNMDNVMKYGTIMIGIVLIGVSCGILSGVFTNLTSFKFSNDLRQDVFKKIMMMSPNQIDQFETGSLITRVTNDITQIQNMVSTALRMMVRAGSMFVLGIVFTIRISSRFSVILGILLPVEILIIILFMRLTFPVFSKIQTKLDRLNTIVHENVSGARVVKAFLQEDYENERFVKANNDYADTMLYVSRLMALLMPLLMLLIYFAQLSIYKMGGDSIFDFMDGNGNMLMVGEISQAITYITMISMSMINLCMSFLSIARAYASTKRVNEILIAKEEIVDGNITDSKVKGEIEFKNVNFQYPASHSLVLKDISFKINQGEMVAIVGSTGCGKSSLVNLITRFYDCNDGKIIIDNIDVKDYNKKSLRNKISICLQKAELFSGSIKDNIAFGNINVTDEDAIWASKVAQAYDFINEKPNGFMEYVEEKGASLSGGQKQRISIARAIARKPEILIFDDATSALDLVTESKLYKELNSSLKDTTKIIVTQRVATAKNCDKIIVLEKGRIVAFDSHNNLLENCELYKDIYDSQLKNGGKIYE